MLNFCCIAGITSTLLMLAIMLCLFVVGTFLCILVFFPIAVIYWKMLFAKKKAERAQKGTVIGIFHPYCNAGGGGERVLWTAIKAIQKKYPDVHIAIYTGDLDVDPEQITRKVEKSFNIKLEPGIEFVYLHKRKWVEAESYSYFTLLGQSLGSMWLGWEALCALQPDIYIDTMGYAFTYPLFKYIGGCSIGSYTHYPTISTDMLKHVYRRVISHNNRRVIARNPFLSAAKMIYYKVFAYLYGYVGRRADSIMVNSSWTEGHINSIWKCPLRTHRVYPPCDVEHLTKLPLLSDKEKEEFIRIVSIGQFRPEKDHPLMLNAMYELRSIIDEKTWEKTRLVFIGSCRNSEDETRVKDMQDVAKHLSLEKNVEFKLNISYLELVSELQRGMIGLHAMWNEHFGISVVECMAAGLIMIAHNSGGPRADIIETQSPSQTGFLAADPIEYAKIIAEIIDMQPEERDAMRRAARASVTRFSGENFEKDFLRALEPFFRPHQE